MRTFFHALELEWLLGFISYVNSNLWGMAAGKCVERDSGL